MNQNDHRQKRTLFVFPFLLLLTIGFFASSCGRETLTSTLTPLGTSTPAFTPGIFHTQEITATRLPSATATETKMAVSTNTIVPTPTETGASVDKSTSSPLILNEKNITLNLERLATIGKGSLSNVKWSPDGKYLAIAIGLEVGLYDSHTYEQIRLININGTARKIAFNPDSSNLAIVRGNLISIWDIKTGEKLVDMEGEIQGGVWELVFGSGDHIAAIGRSERGTGDTVQTLKIWQASTGRLIRSVNNLLGWTVAIDISPDNKKIAYMGEDGLDIRELQSDKKIATFNGYFDVMFSPDDNNKVFTSIWDQYDSGEIFEHKMIDIASGQKSDILENAACKYLARTGRSIICYGNSTVVIFDPKTGETIKTLRYKNISGASISPDGRYLAINSHDRVLVLEVSSGKVIKTIGFDTFSNFAVGQIELYGTLHYVAATSGEQGVIHIWDLEKGNLLRNLQEGVEDVNSLAFSPDRNTLASIDKQSILKLWNIPNGEVINYYHLQKQKADGPMVFSPNGKKISMTDVGQENFFELNLQSGRVVNMGGNPSGWTYTDKGWYIYGANGRLMSWVQDFSHQTLILKDLYTNSSLELPYSFQINDSNDFESVTISSDGNYLAAGHTGGEIIVWDLRNQIQLHSLEGHETIGADGWMGSIKHLTFAPQNNLLLSVGWDQTIRLWDINTGKILKILDGCNFADFSPDGRMLVTAGKGTIKVWRIPPWP